MQQRLKFLSASLFALLFFAVVIINPTSSAPIIEMEQESEFVPTQEVERYLTVGELNYVVLKGRNAQMKVNVTNIHNATQVFDLHIKSANSYLVFSIGEIVLSNHSISGIHYHEFPMDYELVPNEKVSISLYFNPTLPTGVVYMLTSFQVFLEIDEQSAENETVDFLVTEEYDTLRSFNLTDRGALSETIGYEFSQVPLSVYSNSTVTITALNNDTEPHYYTLQLTNRAGRIRSFKGNDAHDVVQSEDGPYIDIPLGIILPHNTREVPIQIMGDLIEGSIWARYMIETTVLVDNESTSTGRFGLDVGFWTEVTPNFRDLIFRFNGDECTITLRGDYDSYSSEGTFGVILPFEDLIIILKGSMPGVLSATMTRVVMPSLFESFPTSGVSAVVVGFLFYIAVGMIIHGIQMMAESGDDPGGFITGAISALVGGLIILAIVCYFRNE